MVPNARRHGIHPLTVYSDWHVYADMKPHKEHHKHFLLFNNFKNAK